MVRLGVKCHEFVVLLEVELDEARHEPQLVRHPRQPPLRGVCLQPVSCIQMHYSVKNEETRGSKFWALGFDILDFGFLLVNVSFKISSLGFRISGFGSRILRPGFRFWAWGVWCFGVRVPCPG